MSLDAVLGCVVTVLSLGALVGLALWCRNAIERTAAGRGGTAREILKDRQRE